MNSDNREGCDDGNNVSGDGCSSTCKVESGWICTWAKNNGKSTCVPKCGNGIIDDDYIDDFGNIVKEECDLGTYNYISTSVTDSDVKLYACSRNCKKRGVTPGVDLHLWTCVISGEGTSKISTCNYNCGNQWLDTQVQEPCDLL